jgi:hypothetical protein
MMKPARLDVDPLRFQILCSVLDRWQLSGPYLFKSSSAVTPGGSPHGLLVIFIVGISIDTAYGREC